MSREDLSLISDAEPDELECMSASSARGNACGFRYRLARDPFAFGEFAVDENLMHTDLVFLHASPYQLMPALASPGLVSHAQGEE
jgi:hypothetical protein